MAANLQDYLNEQSETINKLQRQKEDRLNDCVEAFFEEYAFLKAIRVYTDLQHIQDTHPHRQDNAWPVVTSFEIDYDESKLPNPEMKNTLDSISVAYGSEIALEKWPELATLFVDLYCHDLELGCMTFTREMVESSKEQTAANLSAGGR